VPCPLCSIAKDFAGKVESYAALANRHVLEAGSSADEETLEKCVSVFEETALSTLEHTPAMWNAYCDMLLAHLSSEQIDTTVVMGHLQKVFTRAQEEGSASASLYCKWIDILTKSIDLERASAVCEEALEHHPSCGPVWERYLQLTILMKQEGNTNKEGEMDWEEVIDKASNAIASADAPDASAILQILLHAVMVAGDDVAQLSSVLERFISKLTGESAWLKEAFLQWAMTCMDVPSARAIYNKVLLSSKCSVGVYSLCVAFEKSCDPTSATTPCKLYEQALSLHGKSAPELWLEYISDRQTAGDAQEVGRLYFRATKTLANPADVAKLSGAV
jgi:hypothetical protein